MQFSFQDAVKTAHQWQDSYLIENLNETQTQFHFFDANSSFRYLYITDPAVIDADFISAHIWIHPKLADIFSRDELVRSLSSLPSFYFSSVHDIVILRNAEDFEDYLSDLILKDPELEEEYRDLVPSLDDELLGQYWYFANTVLIMVDHIAAAAKESCDDHESISETILREFWMTLFHELWHQLLNGNPFFDFDDDELNEVDEDEEDYVELRALDDFLAHNKDLCRFDVDTILKDLKD